MIHYTTPSDLAQLAGEMYDCLNDKIGQKLGDYQAKNGAYYRELVDTQQALPYSAPAWHHIVVEEELSNLRQLEFADGIRVPDAWALNYPCVEFGFYLVKTDPADPAAPLLVDYYYHDQRRGHHKIPSLRQATCYTRRTMKDTRPRLYPYLAPEYLPWIRTHGLPYSQDGSRYLLQPKLMLQLAEAPVQPALAVDEGVIRPLTLFRARRLRSLLERHKADGPWNLVMVDFPEGACMHWGGTKNTPSVYTYYPDPVDATALWHLIDKAGYVPPHISLRGWVELDDDEQQELLGRLNLFIKIHLLNSVLQLP